MLSQLVQWFRVDRHALPNWTEARAKSLERQMLERAGLVGHHYQWSRTIRERAIQDFCALRPAESVRYPEPRDGHQA